METAGFIQAVRADLEGLASDDDAERVERIARALEPSLQLRLFDAIGQAALELSEQLSSGHVDVRLSGRDVQLVLVGGCEPPAEPPADDEGTARLTLRMPETLKVRVESVAAGLGMSTNAWLVMAVKRALDAGPARKRVGTRITGFAQT
jgi:hypothetical protein